MKANRGFADRDRKAQGHTGDRDGLTLDDIRYRAQRGWSLSPAHQLIAEKQGWAKR